VREDCGNGEAAGAFDIHEEGAGGGDEGLELMFARLRRRRWVQEIDCENHFDELLESVLR